MLAMGLGEVPLVRQCTFSLWKDTAAMLQYAHQGAHQTASAAAYKHQFFSESLFVRMQVLQMSGLWQGKTFNLPAGVKPGQGATHPTGLRTQPQAHDHALETSHV
jgi:spheroidene monooxygenase